MFDEVAVDEMEETPVPEDESAEPRSTAPEPDDAEDESTGQQVSSDEN